MEQETHNQETRQTENGKKKNIQIYNEARIDVGDAKRYVGCETLVICH